MSCTTCVSIDIGAVVRKSSGVNATDERVSVGIHKPAAAVASSSSGNARRARFFLSGAKGTTAGGWTLAA